MELSTDRWQFWIDRGGTFTDIVAQSPDGKLSIHKLLSENPDRYNDAVTQGIRDILQIPSGQPLPADRIAAIKMGTTVATNALLEHKGDRTVLLVTQGFKDALRIGYQNRPDIFARQIILPEMLYEQVIEVRERFSADAEELEPVDTEFIAPLQVAYDLGIHSCAIAFLHSYRYPQHEQQVAEIAQEMGFTQISVSHKVSPLMKLISRGDTTVLDAYLSPILRRYVNQVSSQIEAKNLNETKLLFMQSHGGLIDAEFFQGKDSILSGPAGGIVGAVQTSLQAGLDKIITFDMGGTSTDVAHYQGEYERSFETEVAGVRIRTPMMAIHTVAAGGGSILQFDGARYRVGPESAGANPGPACYRRGGPLTVTDCNVMLGKLQPLFFPQVFGANGDLPLDIQTVQQQFQTLTTQIQAITGDDRTPEEVAAGFLAIAVDKMATAIKKISVQRGYDVSDYTLCCFGGAGGQHACAIADALGIKQIFIHAFAGVLSAYGMGLADLRIIRERTVEQKLTEDILPTLQQIYTELTAEGKQEIERWGDSFSENQVEIIISLRLRYEGTDSTLAIAFEPNLNNNSQQVLQLQSQFELAYRQSYGFAFTDKALIIEAIAVEIICKTELPTSNLFTQTRSTSQAAIATVQMYTSSKWQSTPVFRREDLVPNQVISSPAIIIDATGTNIIEPNWQAELTDSGNLILKRLAVTNSPVINPVSQQIEAQPDPVKLEIFNNLYRAIAEQMGFTLQNTSYSVNIKERLDFSCAIFDRDGELVANAPHIPVHLGSMSASVQSLIRDYGKQIQSGDVYALNNPYNGGTHLPDITVITPVFVPDNSQPLFYVASRGHHADIGGITPGSMPPESISIEQEGILIDHFKLVDRGRFCESEITELLTSSNYPVRNLTQNLADLQAQIAANECGIREIHNAIAQYGLETVQLYMKHVQDNAELSVRQAIANFSQKFPNISQSSSSLSDSNSIKTSQSHKFTYALDNGSQIQVAIALYPQQQRAVIDFTGTSPQQANNFNAPLAVVKAAVMYVFRTLVDDDIPLNGGCLKPLEIIVPSGSMLNPDYPAAVVAGNVETSQAIVDALYGALGVMAAAQGTMNNFTFGNEQYQYYETICGGSGAGLNFHGTDAVHTHMTNSRLTDPEVLEWRFPVILEEFSIRSQSGGKGKFHGGNGVIRRIKFREPMTAAIISNHRSIPTFGLLGGEPGEVGKNWIELSSGEVQELPSTTVVQLNKGDIFGIATPGGGGYGKL